MSIIVTGGAGMIGSNIIKGLNDGGKNDIIVVDNLKDGKKFWNLTELNISDYFDKIDFFSSEIRKLESIREKSDHDFQLLQKCFLVYLVTDFTWAEVMKMNEIFGLNRNLKKKNKAIMIPNLPKILKECYYGD